MEPLAYAFIVAVAAFTVAILWIDWRTRSRTCSAINRFLRHSSCPSCSGEFQNWNGQVSPNHYQFDGSEVPDVFTATCSKCSEVVDVFHYTDQEIELSPLS